MRPKKELKKFVKVKLNGLEKKSISVDISISDLAVFDRNLHGFVVENGNYIFYISKNAEEDYYKEMIEIKGHYLSSMQHDRIYWDVDRIKGISDSEFERFISRPIPEYKAGRRPYTLETPICEYRTLFGRLVKRVMLSVGDKVKRDARKVNDDNERQRLIKTGEFMKRMILQNCLRSLLFSSGGIISPKQAEGILDIANGKLISGIKKIKK